MFGDTFHWMLDVCRALTPHPLWLSDVAFQVNWISSRTNSRGFKAQSAVTSMATTT